MKKTITVQFDYGETVVLKTKPDEVRIVSGFLVRPKNITYGLVLGEEESWHQDLGIESLSSKVFKVKGFKIHLPCSSTKKWCLMR